MGKKRTKRTCTTVAVVIRIRTRLPTHQAIKKAASHPSRYSTVPSPGVQAGEPESDDVEGEQQTLFLHNQYPRSWPGRSGAASEVRSVTMRLAARMDPTAGRGWRTLAASIFCVGKLRFFGRFGEWYGTDSAISAPRRPFEQKFGFVSVPDLWSHASSRSYHRSAFSPGDFASGFRGRTLRTRTTGHRFRVQQSRSKHNGTEKPFAITLLSKGQIGMICETVSILCE